MNPRLLIIAVTCSMLCALSVYNAAYAAQARDSGASDSMKVVLPEPPLGWKRIAGLDAHVFGTLAAEQTIVSLETSNELVLEVQIFDENRNFLGSFDSTGCGILLNLGKPQQIIIAVVNSNASPTEYFLHIY